MRFGRGKGSARPPRREPTLGSARGRDAVPAIGPEDRIAAPRRGTRERPAAASRSKPRRRRPSVLLRLVNTVVVLGLWGGIALAGVVAWYGRELPPIDQIAVPDRPPNVSILAADGSVLANRGDTGGAAVKLADLPAFLPAAFVAIEDRRFYTHLGIDPVGIARAVTRNLAGGAVQGGSTLTQQLAKNLFLTQERTVGRKIQEAILALWLEHRYSKKQILELYLNRVYFGAGAFGVEAASQRYFGKPARAVSLPEAAVLAGLMKAPTKLAPNRNPAGATERAGQVLAAMRDEGLITPAAAKAALAAPAHAVKPRDLGAVGYAADYVMDVLDDLVGAPRGDIVVTTTIDPAIEAAAERAVADELAAKGGKFGASQGALVALDTVGAVKALVGGRSYADSQYNRATTAKRQPGSAFKPFVYLAALESGLTPDTVREDAPVNVRGWQPENYTREYQGPVTLTRALAQSLNTVAVRLGVEVGPRAVAKVAHRLGVASELQLNASIALGTSEVTPLELATAYAPFANGGVGVQPHIVTKVRTAAGRLLYQRRGTGFGRVVDAGLAAAMTGMMREVVLSGTGRKAELPGWSFAGKTGTSQDFRDAWFVGYTGALVADVWVGNDDGSPTRRASGGGLPVEIWSRFMQAATRGVPPVPLPGLGATPAPAPSPAPQATHPLPLPPVAAAAGPSPVAAASPRTPLELRPVAGAAPAPAAGSLLPPASIPDARSERAGDDRDLLQRLFGG